MTEFPIQTFLYSDIMEDTFSSAPTKQAALVFYRSTNLQNLQ